METPKTLIDACRYFADLTVCEDYMKEIRWPKGVPVCPDCSATGDRIGEITTRRLFYCRDCRKQFRSRLDFMGDSPLSYQQWFIAIWSHANAECSTMTLAAAMGCTQRTAWSARNRIRAALECL